MKNKKYNSSLHLVNVTKTTILVLALLFIIDYITLPAWNLRNPMLYILLAILITVWTVVFQFLSRKLFSWTKFAYLISIGLIAFTVVFGFLSSEMLNASKYQQQIEITSNVSFDSSFESIALNKIPVVDKSTAIKLGEKQIGTIQSLGSQYNVNPKYTIISQNNALYRVANLEYRDFIKWINNRSQGITSFVKVNVSNPSDVSLINLQDGMKILPNALFNDNLYRFVRFNHRDKILGSYAFELDDQNKPYFVVSVLSPEIGLFGGLSAQGAIIVDPVNKTSEYFDIEGLPQWVDHVQPTEIAWSQIDNWGYYINGFFNTLFAQKDMIQTTEGYNYVLLNDQIHVYSGLTSVGSDRSIVGFSLINLRTKEARFYQLGGADEYAAMSSAQGQVQHLGYVATFPVLINIEGVPTYFIALKDREELVKMYAMVAVTNYDAVGVAESVNQAYQAYVTRLTSLNMIDTIIQPTNQKDITILSKDLVVIDGNTYVIFKDEVGDLYSFKLSLNLNALFIEPGSSVKITFNDLDTQVIEIIEIQILE
jgi:energy-coupling factor transporter transmembrane protein EcfT